MARSVLTDSGLPRSTLVVLTAAALCAGLAACGRDAEGGGPAGGMSATRIAIVTSDFTNPYWAALRDGAVAEGKTHGVVVEVHAGSSETDSTGENATISTLAGQQYKCFGVVPVNSTNVITPLVPVAQKGIPILSLDTQIDPGASAKAGVSYASRRTVADTTGDELVRLITGAIEGDVHA